MFGHRLRPVPAQCHDVGCLVHQHKDHTAMRTRGTFIYLDYVNSRKWGLVQNPSAAVKATVPLKVVTFEMYTMWLHQASVHIDDSCRAAGSVNRRAHRSLIKALVKLALQWPAPNQAGP